MAGDFPNEDFGRALETAARLVGGPSRVAALKITLDGFDSHARQAGTHERLLSQLGQGLVALEHALTEMGRWSETLVVTYSEFGRRPRENRSGGTDHGTVDAQFVLGGRVRGGQYGASPDLSRLDSNGNLRPAVDYRSVYATVLERWWELPSQPVLAGRFDTLDFLI